MKQMLDIDEITPTVQLQWNH